MATRKPSKKMADAEPPDYDPVDQGVALDRDQRRPNTIKRARRGYRTSVLHETFAQQLAGGGEDAVLGKELNEVARPRSGQPERCVIYLRVSTEEQARVGGEAEGYSIPYQRQACRELAKQRGWQIIAEYVDAGESARTANRPQLQRMLRELKAKHIGNVIVHKIDRWTRNRSDDVEVSMKLAYAGAKLVSVSESFDDSASGQLLYNIVASVAQYQSQNLATEVVKGSTTKARTGGTPFLAPLGYLNHKEIVDERIVRTIVLDEERAGLIQWALEEFATGEWTIRRLRDELEQRGLRGRPTKKAPAKPVSLSGLNKLLRNPYYAGFVYYNGAYYRGKHQALIDVETWLRIQDTLAAHDKSGEKERRHPHYLKGTVFCGECGARLIYSRNRGRGGTYEYFFCLNRNTKRQPCGRRYYKLSAVEEGVESFYGTFRLGATDVARLRTAVRRELRAERSRAETEAKRASKALARVKDQQSKLLDAHYAGAVPLDLLKIEMDRLTRERVNAEAQLRLTDATLSDYDLQLERLLKVAGDCEAHYLGAPPSIRRQMNQGLFQKLYIHQDGHVEHAEFTEPFATLLTERHASRGASPSQGPSDASTGIDATTGRWRPSNVFLVTYGAPGNDKTPLSGCLVRGSKETCLVRHQGLEPRTH